MSRADFEDEGRLIESVAQPSNVNMQQLVAVGGGILAVAALAYGWYLQGNGSKRLAEREEQFTTARTTPNFGVGPNAAKADNRLVVTPPPPTPTPAAAAQIAAAAPYDDSEARRLAEEERLRRELEAKELARLRSTMLVVDSAVGGGGASAAVAGPDGPVKVQGQEEDANRRFLANASSQAVEVSRATKIARIDALVPQGTMIRGVLETAIQSDLPGMVRAITMEDVYSFDGRRVLIPKATMLTGEYRSSLSRGQTRVFVVWTRMLRADGASVSLGSYGTDDLGRSGLSGEIDRHYFERFGSAIVLSLVGGASAFVAGLNSQGQSTVGALGTQTIAQQGQTQAQQTISQLAGQLANEALKESINIPPTIHVDQGTPIIVFVKRDLDFSDLYPDPVKEALRELRHPTARRGGSGESLVDSPGVSAPGVQSNSRLVTKP